MRRLAIGLLPLLAFAAAETNAQVVRPGIDRPIRVAMFRGTGNTYFHTNIHTSHTVMAAMLADPAAGGLGDSLVIPLKGFNFRTMKTAAGTGGPDGMCGGQATCGPDSAEIAAFVAYLQDSADVMILSSVTNFGVRVTNPAQRQVIADFWSTKGYVGIHEITDTKGYWVPLDTIHGTQFSNHPAEQSGTIRADSVHAAQADYKYLNRSLFSNGTDTTFLEEWLFFTNSGAQIRDRPFLKPTVRLDDATMTPHAGWGTADHPLSWYRKLPTGGRVFYTGLGHRAVVWERNRFFRRQIYNSILWTAKYDSIPTLSVSSVSKASPNFAARAVAQGIHLRFKDDGTHKVELHGMDGRRITGSIVRSEGTLAVPGGVYVLSVSSPTGWSAHRRVAVP